jgi:hypothetical protein
MRRLRDLNERVQLRLGTAIAVLYVAAISLVGVEVVALLLESTLILPTFAPLAPLLILGIGAIALWRRRALRRRAGATVAADHVAVGSRRRAVARGSHAPRRSTPALPGSRHP